MTPISSTEKIGKRIRGNNEVIGKGNASVAHQIPINKKTANVTCPLKVNPGGCGKNKIEKKTKRPK